MEKVLNQILTELKDVKERQIKFSSEIKDVKEGQIKLENRMNDRFDSLENREFYLFP